jgi:hypothetical protein
MLQRNQILDPNKIIGKTIVEIFECNFRDDLIFIFFRDNTWCLIADGLFLLEDYFSSEYTKRSDWRTDLVLKSKTSPKSRKDIKLTPLGKKLVELGEIKENEIIDDWIKNTRNNLETKVIVAETNRRMALELNHDKKVEDARQNLENFKNIFG